ncbi:MAG: competence protein CoiA [Nitrospiria bacterium]
MKFALVNGTRQEAQPDLSGVCPACHQAMVAKCGEIKIWHWAHQGVRLCDLWWENETEWHRAWKGQFPVNWQEVVHQAETGEKHISDVKTDRGWVIEFQHSYLKPEERRSRDMFYRKLIWVVDGTRRKRDRAQVLNAWKGGVPLNGNPLARRISSDTCTLLREWASSDAPIFFDVRDIDFLLWFFPKDADGSAYLTTFPRAKFIESHVCGETELSKAFDLMVKYGPNIVADYEARALKQTQPQPLRSFEPNWVRRARARKRL